MLATDPIKHYQTHHDQAEGYIALGQKQGGSWAQRMYPAKKIEEHIPNWAGNDVYFSQNTFYKLNRRVDTIKQLRSLYVDIDYYNVPNLTLHWVLGHMEQEIFKQSVPDPNMIILSGRGLQCIWHLQEENSWAMPSWQAIQDYIFEQFKHLGADPQAKDAARVFRLAGTTNSKSGETVKVMYRHKDRYSLQELQKQYVPQEAPKETTKTTKKAATTQQTKPKKTTNKQRSKPVANLFNLHTLHKLHWARLQDLVKLVELRSYKVVGSRELICFLYRYWACCYVGSAEKALEQTLDFNCEFEQPLSVQEVTNATRSAEQAWAKKQTDKENKRLGYNFTNEWLINKLNITAEEQTHLCTIISADEKKRRKAEANKVKRRAAGMQEREQYLTAQSKRTADKLEQLKALMQEHPNPTQRQLAEMLKIGYPHVSKMIKKLATQECGKTQS